MADGVFYAELNELLTRELAEHGYSGVEVRVTPMRTEIIIRATRTQNVLGAHSSSFPHWGLRSFVQQEHSAGRDVACAGHCVWRCQPLKGASLPAASRLTATAGVPAAVDS